MQQMISIDNLKVVISIASPFLAAYLASHWALTKHNKEKQWERKQKAYKEIIDSLYDLLQYCEVKKEDYGQGTIVQKGIMNELSNKYSQAFWNIKRNSIISEYIVSKEASEVLRMLKNREKLKWEENPSWEIFEAEYNTYEKVLKDILRISSSDLRKI